MITVGQLQDDLRDLIRGSDYFADETVESEDGTKFDAVEAALRGRGVAVLVLPVVDEIVTTQRPGVVTVDATLLVHYGINPETNADETAGAGHDLEAGKLALIAAVLGAPESKGESRWRLTEREPAVELLSSDPGRLLVEIRFVREAVRYKTS